MKVSHNISLLKFLACTMTSARRCYICGNGSEEPFRTGGRGRGVRETEARIKSSVSCTEFERSSSMDQFIMECPNDFVGCITQIDGKAFTNIKLSTCNYAIKVTQEYLHAH